MSDTPTHDPFVDFLDEGGFDFGSFDVGGDFNQSLFTDVREEDPSGIFFNALSQANLTPNQLQFFEQDQRNVLNQFSGILDKALAEGRLPTETFSGFVEQPGFFQEQFRERVPQSKAAPFLQVFRR